MLLRALCGGTNSSEAGPDTAAGTAANPAPEKQAEAAGPAGTHPASSASALHRLASAEAPPLPPGPAAEPAFASPSGVLTQSTSELNAAAQIAPLPAAHQKHDAGPPVDRRVERPAAAISPGGTGAPAGEPPTHPAVLPAMDPSVLIAALAAGPASQPPPVETRQTGKPDSTAPHFDRPPSVPLALTGNSPRDAGARNDAARLASGIPPNITTGEPRSAPDAARADVDRLGAPGAPSSSGPGASELVFAARLMERTASVDTQASADAPAGTAAPAGGKPVETDRPQVPAGRITAPPPAPPAAAEASRIVPGPPTAPPPKEFSGTAAGDLRTLARDAAPSAHESRSAQALDLNPRPRKPDSIAGPPADASALPPKATAERSPTVFDNLPPARPPLPAAPDAARPVDRGETEAAILRGGNMTPQATRNATADAAVADSRPARDISLRLAVDHRPPVDVSVSDRAGEVRVAVRSADPAMAAQVRSGLSDLAERLDRRGFDAEIWRPPAPAAAKSESPGHLPSRDGGAHERGAPQDRGQEQRQGERRNQPPAWMEEIETSFAATLKGTGV